MRLGVPILLGVAVALVLHGAWSLSTRPFAILIAGTVLVFGSTLFLRRFDDFLLAALLVCIPFAGMIKWFGLDRFDAEERGAIVYSGTLGIGVVDFLLLGLYLTWFVRVFVARTQTRSRDHGLDVLVLSYLLATCISVWGAPDVALGVGAIVYLAKHAAVYLYISRNLRPRHIHWVFFTACLAILVDSAIGVVQNRTGSLRGLGLDKGAAGEALDYQYAVMGIEDITRATGFSYDSHALGAYLAMLLPYPLVASYASSTSLVARVRYVVVFLIGLVGLVVTFSRAAWLSCAIALGISFLILIALRERYAIVTTIVAGALLVSLTPWFATSLHKRFASAPAELMKARFEQYSVAFDVWRDHPLFGYGAGNYMNALRSYNATGALALPVHNVHLWNLAESGLAGAIAFLSIQLGAMWYCWKAIWRHGGWERRFAVAALTGLIAYFLDGLTDPLFREPVVYLMFWLTVGSIAALTRSHETEAGNGHPPHGPAAAG